MKKCTKWRIANLLFWVIGGSALIYEVLESWYQQGCQEDSLWAGFALHGTYCLMFCLLIDSKIRDGFKRDEDKFEYR